MSSFEQRGHQVRFDWGAPAIDALAAEVGAVIIVDVLSFSTSVDIAVSRGAEVLPFVGSAEAAAEFASAHDAILAAKSCEEGQFTLRPSSLRTIPAGARLVLPSLNGSTLSYRAARLGKIVVAACLRNAFSVGNWVCRQGGPILVVAAGEQWPNGSLRPSFEDLIGAGAVIDALPGSRSPEAEAAHAAFLGSRELLGARLLACASGQELVERGFEADVMLAGRLNVSETVPVMQDVRLGFRAEIRRSGCQGLDR